MKRKHKLTVMLSVAELKKLRANARHYGITASELVRRLACS